MLEAAQARVRETLKAQRTLLDRLARLLMEKEVVDREALIPLLAVAGTA